MKIKYLGISAAIFLLSLLSFSVSSASVRGDQGDNQIDVSKIIQLTNADRASNNLGSLEENSNLDLAANLKLDDMIANDYFNHISPQGVSPWYFIKKTSYQYSAAGENLALNFSDPQAVEQAWMNSTEHRQNILNPKFTEIGIAQKETVYNGQRTNFIVEYLAAPNQ
jgi:uncharacterized protein YkwD